MENNKIGITSKLLETATALVIVAVVFGFVTHGVNSVLIHREKIEKIRKSSGS